MVARRHRRTKAELARIRAGLIELAQDHAPASVRQIFYLAVSEGLIAKTEAEYKNTVTRLLSDARLAGDLSWSTITDHTRSVIAPRTFGGLDNALARTARFYRRALWDNQPVRVEAWLEKRTLLGPLRDTADDWDVPIYPCNGYPSLTFLHAAAQIIRDFAEWGRVTRIFYFGDHDPSGVDIQTNLTARLSEFVGEPVSIERLAVHPEQIERFGLPTRPTKATDTRSRGFDGESVEVEAVPPGILRNLLSGAIEDCVDHHELEVTRIAEDSERSILDMLAKGRYGEAESERSRLIGPD